MKSEALDCTAGQLAEARYFLADRGACERGRVLWEFECIRALAEARGHPAPAQEAAARVVAQYGLPADMEAGDFVAACHWRDLSLRRLLSGEARVCLAAIRRGDAGCVSVEVLLERALRLLWRAVEAAPAEAAAADAGAGAADSLSRKSKTPTVTHP